MQITIVLPAGADQSFQVEINQQPVSIRDIALAFICAGIPVQSSPDPISLAWPTTTLPQGAVDSSATVQP